MKSSAKLEVQLLTDALVKAGVTDIVLSPGSRNAPLVIAFDEHPALRTFVIPDERAAAFYAIGIAQQTGRPVAIACTSGSAPLNYFPAVAEAYYQEIPLIVITSDRPEEWVDQGDGQTIVQRNVFGSHVISSGQLSEIHSDAQRWLFERQCAEILQEANGFRKGPVHINIPFSEPLYGVTSQPEGIRNWIAKDFSRRTVSVSGKSALADLWKRSQKVMILAGQSNPSEEVNRQLSGLVKNSGIVVLTEHTSNIHDLQFVHCIDRTLNQINNLSSCQPDLLITIGGAVVSKKIKAFLRKSPDLKTVRIAPSFPFMDTYQSLVLSLDCETEEVLEFLQTLPSKSPDFLNNWSTVSEKAATAHDAALKQTEFSDLLVMGAILNKLPQRTHVHFSNSAVIRYGLLFNNRPDLTYWCNRGTSGIDGSTSTACGAALGNPGVEHLLITGDMSFIYDSNALWNQHLPENLKIVIVNNGGGDIFNIIPGPSSVPQRGKYFVAEQHYSAKGICETFGVNHSDCSSTDELEKCLDNLFRRNGLSVLEVNTSGSENSKILEAYWKG